MEHLIGVTKVTPRVAREGTDRGVSWVTWQWEYVAMGTWQWEQADEGWSASDCMLWSASDCIGSILPVPAQCRYLLSAPLFVLGQASLPFFDRKCQAFLDRASDGLVECGRHTFGDR